jgi:hypothetical protein
MYVRAFGVFIMQDKYEKTPPTKAGNCINAITNRIKSSYCTVV